MSSTIWTRLVGTIAMVVLLATGCSDKSQSPSVTGAPPDFLAGVWEVTDSSANCYPFAPWDKQEIFTDTICLGGPDFGTRNALTTWGMYLRYNEVLPGLWTPLEIESCSGVITDTLVNVFCAARASSTLEDCSFKVRFYTRGIPGRDTWTLLRSVERIEGEDCGLRRGDSIIFCSTYMSVLRRIGDAPESCAEGDSSTIGR